MAGCEVLKITRLCKKVLVYFKLLWQKCHKKTMFRERKAFTMGINPCSPEGFSQTYFPKGGCCNPPSGLSILKVI